MGHFQSTRDGVITSFSKLDEWVKEFIAVSVAYELFTKIDQCVEADEIISLFDLFDIDVHITSGQTFMILQNEKLDNAVAQIVSRFEKRGISLYNLTK